MRSRAMTGLQSTKPVTVSIVGSDPQGHLLGTQAIITTSQSQSPSPASPFRQACYWVAFRQEIFRSLTFQRPFQLGLSAMAPSPDAADDWTWSLRATFQCGKVQAFVFGDKGADAVEYRRLLQDITWWRQNRPESFDPLYQAANEEDGSMPELLFHTDCHGEGYHSQ